MQTTSVCKHGVSVADRYHDCAYVDFREHLVPEASRFANEKAGPRPAPVLSTSGGGRDAMNAEYTAWSKLWNTFFLDYITRKVKERYGG